MSPAAPPQSLRAATRGPVWLGLLAILSVVGGAGAFAAFAPLADGAVAKGRLDQLASGPGDPALIAAVEIAPRDLAQFQRERMVQLLLGEGAAMVEGETLSISAEAVADPQGGPRRHRARIAVSRADLAAMETDLTLAPGAPVLARALGERRTLLQAWGWTPPRLAGWGD